MYNEICALTRLDVQPVSKRTVAEYIHGNWVVILFFVAAALPILGVPPGVPATGSVEIEFDKSYYIVGDRVNVKIYLSNVHPWPIRVQPYNKFDISRELDGEPYGPVDGAFLNWQRGASIYIPPYSREVIHQDYRFKVMEAGDYTVVVELYTSDTLTCTGGKSITVYAEFAPFQREIVDIILRIALIDEGKFDGGILLDQPIPLSSENIGDYTPIVEGIKFRLMTPEEIQREADASGDFLYIRFKRLTFLSENSAVVELDHIWVIGRSSMAEYLSGSGFTMTLNKKSDGSWAYDISAIWVS